MCGITALFGVKEQTEALRRQVLEMSKRIRHRGPDWSGIYAGGSAILAHERLSIVDPASGGQPLVAPDGKQILCVNGEIYNHRTLREALKDEYECQYGCISSMDCSCENWLSKPFPWDNSGSDC